MEIQTEIVSCSNCGSSDYELVVSCKDYNYKTCTNDFDFVKCTKCGQIYLRNRPLVSELSTIYPADKYVAYSGHSKGFLASIKEFFIKSKISPLQKNCGANSLIMEVGCAAGDLIKLVKKYGDQSWQLYAVDISDKHFKELNSCGINTINERFENLRDMNGKFSAVMMNQVIEHLESPREVIRKSNQLLASQGILILETPSTDGWDAKIFTKTWEGWHAPRHWHMFNEKLLGQLVTENGFEILKIEYIFSPYIWIYSIKNHLELNNQCKFLLPYLSLNNFFSLSFVCTIDLIQKLLRGKTSNMRIIARKINNVE